VLFAALDVAPVSKDSHAAVTSGARYVYTRRRPAWDAKARGTMLFPEQILLSYSEFDKAVKEDAARAVHLKTEIDRMLAEISDAKLSQVVQDYCRQNPDMIVEAHNRVSARFDEVRRASAQQSV
jgi:lipopolysaccharide export system protein LptC